MPTSIQLDVVDQVSDVIAELASLLPSLAEPLRDVIIGKMLDEKRLVLVMEVPDLVRESGRLTLSLEPHPDLLAALSAARRGPRL